MLPFLIRAIELVPEVKAHLSERTLAILARKYDPNQPRDDIGRWTDDVPDSPRTNNPPIEKEERISEDEYFNSLSAIHRVDDLSGIPGNELVKENEKEIRKNTVEYKRIFDKDGNLIEKSGGKSTRNAGKTSVSREQMIGGTLTHNHPMRNGAYGEYSSPMGFSDGDYKYAAYYNLKEMRAVCDDWTIIVKTNNFDSNGIPLWPRDVSREWRQLALESGFSGVLMDYNEKVLGGRKFDPPGGIYTSGWSLKMDAKRNELEYYALVKVDQIISKRYNLEYSAFTTRKRE
jgi:hypothetical protein